MAVTDQAKSVSQISRSEELSEVSPCTSGVCLYLHTCRKGVPRLVENWFRMLATVDLDPPTRSSWNSHEPRSVQRPREIFAAKLTPRSVGSASHHGPHVCFSGTAGADCAAGPACLPSSGAVCGRKRYCLYQRSDVSGCAGVVFILPRSQRKMMDSLTRPTIPKLFPCFHGNFFFFFKPDQSYWNEAPV